MTHRYTAAGDGWLAFITPARQLFVGAELEPAVVDRLWSRLRDERGPAGLLETLTANGLFATPPFAFVEAGDGGVSVIVRGDASVRAGAEQVSGAGATTWIERRMPGGSVGVTLGGRGGVELPIEAGVVRASAFASGAASPVGTVAQAAPAPAATPAARDDFTPPPAPAPVAPHVEEVSEVTVTSLPEEAADGPRDAPAASAASAEPSDGYDYLFGDTMYRSVEDAAVRPAEAEEGAEQAPPAEAEAEGDHDGSTVLASSITRTGRQRRTRGEAAAPAAPSVVVVLPSGTREPLDEPLLLGRSPSVSGVSAGQLPRLVTITGGDQDISRSHLRVALEGGTVVVTDLHSRNGTTVVMPNGESQKLRGGEPTPVIVGTRIDLGGGVELSVEEV
ncbi:MAG: FHA domain-containing protein [Protaetiibacter sp.]